MSTLKCLFLGLGVLYSLTTLPAQWASAQSQSEMYRTWTDQHGRTLSAYAKHFDEKHVVLVDRRGKERSVTRSALSSDDQQLIAAWSKRKRVVRLANHQVEGPMENRSVGGATSEISRILKSPEVLSAIEKM